jgi:hypothetical protein
MSSSSNKNIDYIFNDTKSSVNTNINDKTINNTNIDNNLNFFNNDIPDSSNFSLTKNYLNNDNNINAIFNIDDHHPINNLDLEKLEPIFKYQNNHRNYNTNLNNQLTPDKGQGQQQQQLQQQPQQQQLLSSNFPSMHQYSLNSFLNTLLYLTDNTTNSSKITETNNNATNSFPVNNGILNYDALIDASSDIIHSNQNGISASDSISLSSNLSVSRSNSASTVPPPYDFNKKTIKYDSNNNSNSNSNSNNVNNQSILVTNIEPPKYIFNPPKFNLPIEISKLIKLAHRNKDINISDVTDTVKAKEIKIKILKKLKKKNQKIQKLKKSNNSSLSYSSSLTRKIGRPLTPKTKVRLTLIPNLPTLYSMLVTESIDISEYYNNNNNNKCPQLYKEMKNKFKILKKGMNSDHISYQELLFDDSIDWRFKTTTIADMNENEINPLNNNDNNSNNFGGVFPGKSQTVTFLDCDEDSIIPNDIKLQYLPNFPNAIGLDSENIPVYRSVDSAVREVFDLREYTFLRITRSAAFERMGAVVLKMETAKPGEKWLDDDEFDLNLLYKLFGSDENNCKISNEIKGNENEHEIGNHNDDDLSNLLDSDGIGISTTFLKKKIARPRYKSNMRIYLIPRNSNVILYTREKMLRRDIINGTLNLNDKSDPRMIITAFNYENVLKDLHII